MPAESYDQNGRLQYNTELYTYFLRKTGTVTSSGGGGPSQFMRLYGMLAYPNALVGFSGGNGHAMGFNFNGAYGGSDYREYIVEGGTAQTFNYYVFERSDTVPNAGFGEECFNAAGQRTWSSAYRPMRAKSIIGSNGGADSRPGRTLGFIPTSYTGYNYYEDYEPEPSYYWHDWSIYAAANGPSAYATDLSRVDTRIVEVPGGRGQVPDPQPPAENMFDIPGKYIVFDATGIPIGTTFF